MRKFIIIPWLFLALAANLTHAVEKVPLADGHALIVNTKNWHYVRSNETFKKSFGLIELVSNEDIKGLIDTEIRFINPKIKSSNEEQIQKQCSDLKNYWSPEKYKVERFKNYCIVKGITPNQKEKLIYQVIETRVSRSRSDMYFVHTWTFHFAGEHFKEAETAIRILMEEQK